MRLREPWDHPWDGPYLPAWGGHYDHAFVALHPFYRDRERPWVGAVSWGEVARACGSPPFVEFAPAVWDLSYYETDADPALVRRIGEVIERLDLIPPADSWLNEALIPACCPLFRALGIETVRVRDNLSRTEAEAPLATIEADPGMVHAEALESWATAVFDASYRLMVTTQPMSDCQRSVVAMTTAAISALGGSVPLEGFLATATTSDCWINEPGTYTYPGWLREAPHAA